MLPCILAHIQSFLCMLSIHKSKTKSYGHQLGPMTHFHEPKIWPSFIFLRVRPLHTFAKLPVHALINVLKKLDPKNFLSPNDNIGTMTYFLKVGQSPKVPFWHISKASCACSKFKIKKKSYGHQLGPMTHFLMNQKFDPILYLRRSHLHTHLQSFLCMP